MRKAVIYLRSATGNGQQTRRQEQFCREYLDERDLTDAGTVTDSGRPQPDLTRLLDAAAQTGATEVVVADLFRLGSTPTGGMRNFDTLQAAGLTIHVAAGTLSGPVLDDCVRHMMFQFDAADPQLLDYDCDEDD